MAGNGSSPGPRQTVKIEGKEGRKEGRKEEERKRGGNERMWTYGHPFIRLVDGTYYPLAPVPVVSDRLD